MGAHARPGPAGSGASTRDRRDILLSCTSYSYAYDAADRREHNQRSGVAFATGPFYEVYGYNGRGELTSSADHTGTYDTGTPDPNDSCAYTYDALGNRATYTPGTQSPVTYVTNGLNQYGRVDSNGAAVARQGLRYDADGNLVEQYVAADMNCDGVLNYGDIAPFQLALSDPEAYATQYPNCDILNGDINGDGATSFADITPFSNLLSGGLGATGLRVAYTYDAENRLVGVTPLAPTTGSQKVTLQYDYLGRRVEKAVYNWGGSEWETSPWYAIRYVYDGWRLLLEINQVDAVFRSYTWGLDVAGQMNGSVQLPGGLEAAGGIGGLLAEEEPVMGESPRRRAYLYDANGNVTQVVNVAADPNDPAGAIIAKYEYDPYGNNLLDPNDPNESGTFAATNPFRFSTKYFDVETGLAYFGGRYYHAALGRWLNRDPIGELGGANLYGYALNDPVDHIDPLGHAVCVPGWHGCTGTQPDYDGGGRCPKKGQSTTRDPRLPEPPPWPPEGTSLVLNSSWWKVCLAGIGSLGAACYELVHGAQTVKQIDEGNKYNCEMWELEITYKAEKGKIPCKGSFHTSHWGKVDYYCSVDYSKKPPKRFFIVQYKPDKDGMPKTNYCTPKDANVCANCGGV